MVKPIPTTSVGKILACGTESEKAEHTGSLSSDDGLVGADLDVSGAGDGARDNDNASRVTSGGRLKSSKCGDSGHLASLSTCGTAILGGVSNRSGIAGRSTLSQRGSLSNGNKARDDGCESHGEEVLVGLLVLLVELLDL